MAGKTDLTSLGKFPPLAITQGGMTWNITGTGVSVVPLHENRLPPCHRACPAGVDLQKVISFIAEKKLHDAYQTIREVNPLPACTGRTCYHPCEGECCRREYDGALSIHNLERFLGDWGLENMKTEPARIDRAKGEVAIIGSGPSGISAAWRLANSGYKVTVFEALKKPGGMLRAGIPKFRMPRRVLDQEFKSILARGITLKTGVRVGTQLKFEDLLKKYRAIYVAVGAHLSKPVDVPGEETPGVETAIRFLERVNSGTHEKLSGPVAIIGGGYTAVDVARSAVRLGGNPLIFYNRCYEEMPAIRDEIGEAEHEGIEINFLMAPKEISRSGRNLKLTLQKLTLSKKDDSGMRHPIAVRGTEHDIVVSKIVLAVGEDPDLSFLPQSLRRDPTRVETNGTHRTEAANVFAGGDCTDDRRAMADAIGAGRRAAEAIDAYLQGETPIRKSSEANLSHFSGLNLDYFPRTLPLDRKQIASTRRLKTFAEVNLGISLAVALREARRCFSCGVCTQCDNCWVFCPDIAVSRTDGTYSVDYDHCKGCGICAQECPRDAIHMVPREQNL